MDYLVYTDASFKLSIKRAACGSICITSDRFIFKQCSTVYIDNSNDAERHAINLAARRMCDIVQPGDSVYIFTDSKSCVISIQSGNMPKWVRVLSKKCDLHVKHVKAHTDDYDVNNFVDIYCRSKLKREENKR